LIGKLTENLLFRNSLLNQEIEIMFPKSDTTSQQPPCTSLADSKYDHESSVLFERCLEYALDHELMMKILWHRIYDEPLVMKFISMRHSNYANNVYFNHSIAAASTDQTNKHFLLTDSIPFFPLV
jgi:hypothetical protein